MRKMGDRGQSMGDPARASISVEELNALISQNEANEAELKKLRQVVVHLTKVSAIGTTAAMLVHELAQPITGASNYLAACRRLLSKGEETTEALQVQEGLKAAEECLARASDIMGSVRERASGKVFKARPVELRSIVDDVLRLYGTGWDFLFKINIAPSAARVLGDKVQLAQVISNLIRNAADATEGQAVRSIALTAFLNEDNMVEVRVSDNGPGIPDALKSEIFSPFASAKADGIGVGLSICRAIIEQHSGRIWAETAPLKTQLCFTLLPAG